MCFCLFFVKVADSIRSLLLQNTTMFKSSTILDESSLCSSYQYFISQFQKRKIILLDDVPNDTVLSKFIPVNKEVHLYFVRFLNTFKGEFIPICCE